MLIQKKTEERKTASLGQEIKCSLKKQREFHVMFKS